MIRLMAEYRIKDGTLDVVENVVKEFVAAVQNAEPDTQYTPFRVGESDRLIHIMAFLDQATRERHQKAGYTSEFVEALYPNCSELPTFSPLEVIE